MARRSWAMALPLMLAGLAGCGGASTDSAGAIVPTPTPTPAPLPAPAPTPAPTPASSEREIAPADTGPGITADLAPHVIINPGATAKGRLFVMLPGTGGTPRFQRLILRTGASRGYHVIGLTYPNDVAVEDLCKTSPDPDCPADVRREIITGADTSALVSVDAANSITGRLRALLILLARISPDEGWGRFLRAGEIDWPLVTVAGHSQGAGHAAFLAKRENLDRAVMFSGVGDTGVAPGSSAAWLTLPNVTPASRQYGFTHVADDRVPLALVRNNWARIGLDAFGPLTSVDGATAPYDGSRQLTTAAVPGNGPAGSPTHGAPVVDTVTPLTSQGTPLFAPVWIYLAFP